MWLFRALTDRLKAMFIADVALDFEAQILTRDAERKAELLRQAQKYEQEGLKGIAQHMREQAESMNVDRPLASVLPSIEHWERHCIRTLPAPRETSLALEEAAPVKTNNTRKGR